MSDEHRGRATIELNKKFLTDRARWIEYVVAGLINDGVSREEIEVQDHDNSARVWVLVRGVPRYEWKQELT